MPEQIVEHYRQAPSALDFMRRAICRPFKRLAAAGGLPQIALQWTGWRIGRDALQIFHQATGLTGNSGVSILYPHAAGFRLQMALLTHRAYPLPIWHALQIRNRLVQHRRLEPSESMDLETRIGGHRYVDKGIEIDLVSRLTRGADCYWESLVTYFYRGRFGGPAPATPAAPAPLLTEGLVADRLVMPARGGWAFGELTGDYNGIHNWSWYARRFGFPAAFLHPQRVAGMCLAKLEGPATEAQTLELWIKGPVFYGADALLHCAPDGPGRRFGLALAGDPRMALVGRWSGGAPGSRGRDSTAQT